MSAKNRGDRIQLLHKVVTKHFEPVPAPDDRSVLEHLLYACCLEDASYEAADEAFHRLRESFFDWNEIRVTTVTELCEHLQNLPDPAGTALRVKRNLQSLFETRYSFDIDDMIKMNQGKAVQELEKLAGMSKFVLGYVTQYALGGHAIPVSGSIMKVLLATEIVSEAEAAKWLAPGLERTVPKTKGHAFGSGLHQLAVMYATAADDKQTRAVMKEAGATEPAKPAPAKKSAKKSAPKPVSSAKKSTSTKKAATKKSATSKSPASKPAKKTTKKAAAASSSSKKPAAAKKSGTSKSKSTPAKNAKRKPR